MRWEHYGWGPVFARRPEPRRQARSPDSNREKGAAFAIAKIIITITRRGVYDYNYRVPQTKLQRGDDVKKE